MRITSLPSKLVSVVNRVAKFSLNLINNVIAWLWNNQFGLYYQIMIDYWLFDECARGTHYRKIMCDGL